MSDKGTPATAYIGLGSNLGDRFAAMRDAVLALDAHPHVRVDFETGVASLYETSPVGGPSGQEAFLNTAVRVFTTLSPVDLLSVAMSIERSLGRVRRRRWEARVIDIDLLLYDDLITRAFPLFVWRAAGPVFDARFHGAKPPQRSCTACQGFSPRGFPEDKQHPSAGNVLHEKEIRLNDRVLSLPHSCLHERRFVLEPLAEIAGDVIHPVLKLTIADLAGMRRIEATSQTVTPVAGPRWPCESCASAVARCEMRRPDTQELA